MLVLLVGIEEECRGRAVDGRQPGADVACYPFAEGAKAGQGGVIGGVEQQRSLVVWAEHQQVAPAEMRAELSHSFGHLQVALGQSVTDRLPFFGSPNSAIEIGQRPSDPLPKISGDGQGNGCEQRRVRRRTAETCTEREQSQRSNECDQGKNRQKVIMDPIALLEVNDRPSEGVGAAHERCGVQIEATEGVEQSNGGERGYERIADREHADEADLDQE